MSQQDNPLKDILIGKMSKAWAENNQIPVNYLPQTESTNALAKHTDLADNDFCLFITDLQTAGKGRGQNTWQSIKGSSLLSTWTFYLPAAPHSSFTSRVGLALWRALKTTWTFVPFALKAPNDIYVNDKKLAGILIETVTQGSEVITHIGVGLNVLTAPEEVATATSLIHSLPKSLPLQGQDWVRFLDRFFFELTEAITSADEALTATDRENLKVALNEFVLLETKYDDVLETAELMTNGKKIPWSQI